MGRVETAVVTADNGLVKRSRAVNSKGWIGMAANRLVKLNIFGQGREKICDAKIWFLDLLIIVLTSMYFQLWTRNSIRDFVRPSVHPSVRQSVMVIKLKIVKTRIFEAPVI